MSGPIAKLLTEKLSDAEDELRRTREALFMPLRNRIKHGDITLGDAIDRLKLVCEYFSIRLEIGYYGDRLQLGWCVCFDSNIIDSMASLRAAVEHVEAHFDGMVDVQVQAAEKTLEEIPEPVGPVS